jgi:hypothetical protein
VTTLSVRPEAELDAFEAALRYEEERPGLGASFLEAMRLTFQRIEASPKMFPVVWGDVRRAMPRRFPFGIFFYLEGDTATVIAVMHLHRHPASWQRRR